MSSSSSSFKAHEDELRRIATALCSRRLAAQPYEHDLMRGLIKELSDELLAEASAATGRLFKVIVNVVIVQTDAGAGLCTHSAVLWDSSQDGAVFVTVPTEHLTCVVTLYGLSV